MSYKKFSQFNLPSVPTSELFLVGYEVGTGDNGENRSIRIKSTDLSFGVAGSAGLASLNGLAGSVIIEGDNGIEIENTGNRLTIKNTNPVVIIDSEFDNESDNPQSGKAIARELASFAKVDESNSFVKSQFFTEITTDSLTTNTRLRNNGTTILNGSVIIQGLDAVQQFNNASSHFIDDSRHFTTTDRENYTSLLNHSINQDIHLTMEEKNNLATKDELNLKADKYLLEATETITDYDNKGEWETDSATIKYFQLSKQNVVYGTITEVGLGSANRYGDQTTTTSQNPHYLMLEIIGSNGQVKESHFSKEPKIAPFGQVTYWEFDPFILYLAEGESIKIYFSQDGETADRDATFRAQIVKENGSNTTNNGSNAVGSNGVGNGWIIRTIFKCTVHTTIHDKINNHVNNSDLHLTPEEKNGLLELLMNKEAILSLIQQ